MFVVDVSAMRRRSEQASPSGHWLTGVRGPSRSGVAGFAPGRGRPLTAGSARVESPVRAGARWLLVGVLCSFVAGCEGAHDHAASVPVDVRASAPADPGDVVIQGARQNVVPVAARRVGERFLNGYVAFLYGRGSVDEIEGATRELGRVLRRARVRVPPARAARSPRILGLQSTEQSPATVVVTVIVDDGDLAAYPVTALVERRAGSWRVIRLADD